MIKLKVISKLNLSRQKTTYTQISLDNFDRCCIEISDEDEQTEMVENGSMGQGVKRGSRGEEGTLVGRSERDVNDMEKGDWLAVEEREETAVLKMDGLMIVNSNDKGWGLIGNRLLCIGLI